MRRSPTPWPTSFSAWQARCHASSDGWLSSFKSGATLAGARSKLCLPSRGPHRAANRSAPGAAAFGPIFQDRSNIAARSSRRRGSSADASSASIMPSGESRPSSLSSGGHSIMPSSSRTESLGEVEQLPSLHHPCRAATSGTSWRRLSNRVCLLRRLLLAERLSKDLRGMFRPGRCCGDALDEQVRERAMANRGSPATRRVAWR
jgi:hypothetical protein